MQRLPTRCSSFVLDDNVSDTAGVCTGPKTPWSADWVTSFLTSGGKSRSGSRRASSISPTRLFEFNGDNTVPDPEDLFNCWHRKLSRMDGPRGV